MSEAGALDVMNRLTAAGRIGNYAIAGDAIAWTRIAPTLTQYADILVSPAADAPPAAALGQLLGLMAHEGYARRGEYGLLVEGWDVAFTVAVGALANEAVERAMERKVPVAGTDRLVRCRILRPEHWAAVMMAADRPSDWRTVAGLVEDEEVDMAVLADVIGRHGLETRWRRLCALNGLRAHRLGAGV